MPPGSVGRGSDCARQGAKGRESGGRVEPGQNPRLGSARLGSARLGSARLGSARLGSARLGSARLGSARLGSARLGSARLGSARLGSARLGSARLGSARLGSARLGSARLGSARLGSARLGSARLGSARLGSARLIILFAASSGTNAFNIIALPLPESGWGRCRPPSARAMGSKRRWGGGTRDARMESMMFVTEFISLCYECTTVPPSSPACQPHRERDARVFSGEAGRDRFDPLIANSIAHLVRSREGERTRCIPPGAVRPARRSPAGSGSA